MNTKEQDKEYFGRGNPAFDLEVARAEGSYIYDTSGKKYIDFLGGAGVGSLGWGNREIQKAIRDSDSPSYVYPHFRYRPWSELAQKLAEITPGNLKKSFRATGGSEAVEAAMQMAMMHTGRKKFVSVEGAYHGNTIGAISIGATKKQENFPNLLPGCEKIQPPLNKEKLQQVEQLLASKEVAAFIMEPVIVNLGVIIPEMAFMQGLQELCRKYGSLLVMDEAITGFGRTGKMFASEHYDLEPDILCMAKAITAGHMGMGAVITTEEVAASVEEKIGLYSSYGWHPLSVDASLATIKYLQEHQEDLFQHIRELENFFRRKISELEFRQKADIRIKGAAIGIDVQDKDYASEIRSKSLKAGLLMNTEGSTLLFLPNFLMTEETVSEGFDLLKSCI